MENVSEKIKDENKIVFVQGLIILCIGAIYFYIGLSGYFTYSACGLCALYFISIKLAKNPQTSYHFLLISLLGILPICAIIIYFDLSWWYLIVWITALVIGFGKRCYDNPRYDANFVTEEERIDNLNRNTN